MQTPKFRRYALCPKPEASASRIIQPMHQWFDHLAGPLLPDERRALRQIIAGADLLEVGDQTYLLAPVLPATLDALAAFEAEAAELEEDNEDRCTAHDDSLAEIGAGGASDETLRAAGLLEDDEESEADEE